MAKVLIFRPYRGADERFLRQKHRKKIRDAENLLSVCVECGGPATLLCDAVIAAPVDAVMVSKTFGRKHMSQTRLCNMPLCERCATRNRNHDYCRFHAKESNRAVMADVPNAGRYKNMRVRLNGAVALGLWNLDKIEELE